MMVIEKNLQGASSASANCPSTLEMSPTYIFMFESDFADFANKQKACEEFYLAFSAIIRHEFELNIRTEAAILPQRLDWMTGDFCTSATGEDGIFLAGLYACALERFRADVAANQRRVDAIFAHACAV